jgi:nucleoside-diphosphate-sugar epimerase
VLKIFVTGATGYIGFNVALALRRAGHRVWGLVRNEEKAQVLAQNEIIPIMGSMQNPESYLAVAEQCSVLIHAATEYSEERMTLERLTIESFIKASKGKIGPKTLIYTSGVWVYGDTNCGLVDETTPLNPAKLVSWRPAVEEMVLNASEVRGIVVRPGCVYGRGRGMTGSWFKGAYMEESLKAIGDGKNHWAMVQVDDLAQGYLAVAESDLNGEIFNFTDQSRLTVGEMVTAVAKVTGYSGPIESILAEKAAQKMGDYVYCLALDQHVDSSKARRLLGWHPRHLSFVDEVDLCFESWKAHQS